MFVCSSSKVRCNQFNVTYHIAQYTSIIADLRKEIFRLKMKIEEHEMEDSKSKYYIKYFQLTQRVLINRLN